MVLFRMTVNETKLHAQIQANKRKPITKSKWQQRMENLVKQQQAAAAQKSGNSNLPATKKRGNTSLQNKKK